MEWPIIIGFGFMVTCVFLKKAVDLYDLAEDYLSLFVRKSQKT